MLSSRNLLRQSLFVLMAADLKIDGGPWAGVSDDETVFESWLDKLHFGGEDDTEEKAADFEVRLEVEKSEQSAGLKLFGSTTGKL